MKTILKIIVAIIIAIVIIVIGVVFLVGGVANEVDKELKKENEQYAITPLEFKSIKVGTPRRVVEEELGKPDPKRTQVTEVEGLRSTCTYYNIANGGLMDAYQLCYDGGRLVSKSQY